MIGNVVCRLKAENESTPKIMIFAHMDEIGFIIRKIEPNGFLRFERIGGVNTQALPGTKVQSMDNKSLKGLIGVQAHHFMSPENKFKVPQIKEMYIDIGAASRDEVIKRGINVGDMFSFDDTWTELTDRRVSSKAIDNRIGCSILLELLEGLREAELNAQVYLVACVMEEFNIRGILPVVREIKPDIAIGVDITPACDTPDLDYNDIAIGKGPALTYMNFHGRGTLAGVLPDRKLINTFENICINNNIPYQREVAPGVVTENAYILFENQGTAVMNLSILTRYTHTSVEAVDISDAENATGLVQAFIRQFNSETEFGKKRR
jgi:putative aminopeptidase FrvX